MKSIRIHQFGGPQVLMIEDLPEPQPKSDEVQVTIKASGLNHLDVWIRQGALKLPLPLTPGADGAGIITKIGSKVRQFKIGDPVVINPGFGCGRCRACQSGNEVLCLRYEIYGEHCDGTHRQMICLPEDRVIPISPTLSFDQAAAFPLVFMTSWHMLVTKGNIQPGDDVLVMAGASGIGSAGIQIAKYKGARVITTVGSEEHKKKAHELGADEVIDHYKEDIGKRVKELTRGKGVEVILEHVGAKVWQACLKSLAKGGRLVTCGATTGPQVSIDLRHVFMKHQQILGSTMGNKSELMEISQLISQKKLKPVIHGVLPYTQIQKAHQIVEKGGLFGKVILNWS